MQYIRLAIIFFIGFLFRSLFNIKESSDVSVRLLHIKKSKIFGFGKLDVFNSIFHGIKDYHSFPHFILSPFPEKDRVSIGYLPNIISDRISIFSNYFAEKSIFLRKLIPIDNRFIKPHLMVIILYRTTPIMLRFASHLKSFNERNFRNLINISYFSKV